MDGDRVLRSVLIGAAAAATLVELVGLATDKVTISQQVRRFAADAPVETGAAFVLATVWFSNHIWDRPDVWVPWVIERYGPERVREELMSWPT